jgi:hypothetical protein
LLLGEAAFACGPLQVKPVLEIPLQIAAFPGLLYCGTALRALQFRGIRRFGDFLYKLELMVT